MQLWGHPLSSFCWKATIALYEKDAPFTLNIIEDWPAFMERWPIGKMPMLEDGGRRIGESSTIIEYLDAHHPGGPRLIPADADEAREARYWDRFFDHYLQHPMQRIIANRLRPADKRDPLALEEARALIARAYGVLDAQMAGKTWAIGEAFTLADCAAAPALFYADRVLAIPAANGAVAAYLERLKKRPSIARTMKEAEPYAHLYPQEAA